MQHFHILNYLNSSRYLLKHQEEGKNKKRHAEKLAFLMDSEKSDSNLC